ncbi:MAG: bifunctional phosphopantothenoylcysteine decarboxylase/phosphopantothenate--cysteine ligase CoaBC [Nocardioidaceae bacterium]
MVASVDKPRIGIILGVSGGIAAYKACDLLRRLTESGHDVTVVPTRAALRFVGAPTWEALSGKPVSAEVFDDVPQVQHVRLGQHADLVLVAPATADLLARAAHGRADDLLTSTLLTARCPVVYAPAMHTEMWLHPATQDNVATLRSRGAVVIEPAYGRLTGVDTGPGRLPEPAEIFSVATDVLGRGVRQPDLVNRRVVISAGGTHEALDPVRYLGNRSSGRQGYAVAAAAVARGADVTVVAANVSLPDPAGAKVLRVGSTSEMYDAVLGVSGDADAVVMAAAPADFRPRNAAGHKIKKTSDGTAPTVELEQNPDILAGLVAARDSRDGDSGGRQVLVGFAAETGDDDGDVREHARAKLARKGCDLLVVNDVSGGAVFGADESEAVILSADGDSTPVPPGPKVALAHAVWDHVGARWPTG